jgi:hypothetical protein
MNSGPRTLARISATILFGMALVGCSGTSKRMDVEPTAISMAQGELPEAQLLDVGIETFELGTEGTPDLEEEGIFPDIRKAESRFMPVHLKNTMQLSGHWGAVRVIPTRTDAVDVIVTGEILRSDGETLELRIDAHDATGRRWFSHVYEEELESESYNSRNAGDRDPFQDLYNTIANDLAKHRASLTPDDLENIRRVAQMRFAAWLAPEAFRTFLTEDEDGIWHVNRLPARDDPMVQRVLTIREREFMLIDTVTAHYEHFYADMQDPYRGWRQSRVEELEAMRELERKAWTRKLLGGALIAGAIAADILGGGGNTASLRNVMLIGGAMAMKSGFDLSGQTEIHEDAIRELGVSFDSEVKPLVVEVDGETVELTGSAETQYANWRRLLQSIYFTETGLRSVEIQGAVKPESASGNAEPAPTY